jgi:hypothetical protein
MTEEEINAAISRFIGKKDGECGCVDCRPDWCNDLNAMHEAEKMLTQDQREIFYPKQLGAWVTPTTIVYATARQRAEAFLRALGKWQATTEESSAVEGHRSG